MGIIFQPYNFGLLLTSVSCFSSWRSSHCFSINNFNLHASPFLSGYGAQWKCGLKPETMEDKNVVEKLTNSNWSTWKFQLEHLLKAKNQWKDVKQAPQDLASTNAEKAFSTIVLSISAPLLYLITSCTNGHEAWEKLKSHFDRSTTANKLYLKKSYFRCTMSEGMKVEEHLRKMKELTDAMTAINVVISEEDQVVTLLGSLPPSYSTLVTALETRDELKLDFVQQALLNEQQKHFESAAGTNEAGSSERIMKMQSSGHSVTVSGHSGGEKKFEFNCYRCGKKGHMRKDCRVNLKKKTDHTKSVKDEADDYSFKVMDFQSHYGRHSKSHPGRLLVDCGATMHIVTTDCIMKENKNFDSSEHYIELADGSRQKNIAVKRGDASVSLIDDSGNVINVTLKNALYIPSYPTSIFSVQCATENGAEVHFGNDHFLQACHKQFPIVKEGRLFFLNVCNDDHVNVTKTMHEWHRVLGHCNMLKILRSCSLLLIT